MKSPNRKKLFRADAEGKKKLTPEGGKLLTAGIALAAIAVVVLFAGVGFFGGRMQSDSQLTLREMQESMKDQMQAEMKTASDYLEKLDDSIAENQKKLGNRESAARKAAGIPGRSGDYPEETFRERFRCFRQSHRAGEEYLRADFGSAGEYDLDASGNPDDFWNRSQG